MNDPQHVAGRHTRPMVISKLTAPFDRHDIRFKKGRGGKWYPYFDADAITTRLNSATDYSWDLVMEPWEWRVTFVAAYGHMTIPGLGKRCGVGIQEHTSDAGNEMGADMIKGVRADLLKNCAIAFGCGDQFRSMDPIPFDPDDERNRDRLNRYLDFYFPAQQPTIVSPEHDGGKLTCRPEARVVDGMCPHCSEVMFAEECNCAGWKNAHAGATPEPDALRCTDCPSPINAAQKALSMRHFGAPLCPSCQKARKAAA